MSGQLTPDFRDEREALAAEYVLGVLDGPARDLARERMLRDPQFARYVRDWEARLAPLADGMMPVAPPDRVWVRIEASLDDAAQAPARPVAARSRAGLWRGTTFAAFAAGAVAAGLAVFIFLREPPPGHVEAVLSAAGSPVFFAAVQPDGAIAVRAVGTPTVPAGRDLELWALPQGAVRPVSLGVLPGTGKQVPRGAAISPGTKLLVSLEPAGGSPTGQPTGPVVYAGTLEQL